MDNLDTETIGQLLIDNADKLGSSDWFICVNEDGLYDCQHRTYDTSGWTDLASMYSIENIFDGIDIKTISPSEAGEWFLDIIS